MGLPDLKRKGRDALALAGDLAGLIVSASGATAIAILGKLAAAVVLGAIAVGFFLRLTSRRRVQTSVPATSVSGWVRALASCLSIGFVAALVEAVDLPVRFHQPGFEPWHWLLVAAALAVLYSLIARVVGRFIRRDDRRAPQS